MPVCRLALEFLARVGRDRLVVRLALLPLLRRLEDRVSLGDELVLRGKLCALDQTCRVSQREDQGTDL